MNGDSDSPGASWTRHNKVRARLEKDGALEVQVDGLTTQAKYYKPLLKDFFRLHFPVRPRWGDWSAHIVMEFTGEQALKEYAGSDAQKEWYKVYEGIRERSTTFDITN